MKGPVPYLFFQGNCRDAFEFYAKALGGKILAMMKNSDAPKEHQAQMGPADSVMHACLELPGGGLLMASDSPPEYYRPAQGFAVSVHPASIAEAERVFGALSDGGQVTMPLGQTFWAARFGMCSDRFGTAWMVNCEKDA